MRYLLALSLIIGISACGGKNDTNPAPDPGDLNSVPVARFTTSIENNTLNFDGSSSFGDGPQLSFLWQFGDGQSGSDISGQHSYTEAGSYTITLTVTDVQGVSHTDSSVVEISEQQLCDAQLQLEEVSLFNSQSLLATGSYNPNCDIDKLLINSHAAVLNNGSFQIELTLPLPKKQLNIQVLNGELVVATKQMPIDDQQAPKISQINSQVIDSQLLVTGKVSDPFGIKQLSVDGISTTVSNNGLWQVNLALPKNTAFITIEVADYLDNQSSDKHSLNDNTPPQISEISSQTNNQQIVTIQGKVEEWFGISSFTLAEQTVELRVNGNWQLSMPFPSERLLQGKVVDASGNVTDFEYQLPEIDAQEIKLVVSSSEIQIDNTLLVTGTYSSILPLQQLLINNKTASWSNNQWQVKLPLPLTSSSLLLQATDNEQNQASIQYQLADQIAPEFTINSMQQVSGSQAFITLRGSVHDNSGVHDLQVNGQPASINAQGQWSVTLSSMQDSDLEIQVQDRFGNQKNQNVDQLNEINLLTWGHSDVLQQAQGALAENQVRQSPYYQVSVSHSDDSNALNAFTYVSIPRNGMGKQGYSETDGAEFSADANMSLSWSSFAYASKVQVIVTLLGDQAPLTNISQVTLRPKGLNFEMQRLNDSQVQIELPYQPEGYKFSVEFDGQQMTSYNNMSGDTGQLTTQSGGDHRKIHTEPRNGLMIFASPSAELKNEEFVPNSQTPAEPIYYPEQGKLNLDGVNNAVIYFKPGIYSMPWNYHALLNDKVRWIYLAPGAYVKGAFQYPSGQQAAHYKVTGYGVISGENYIYEADTNSVTAQIPHTPYTHLRDKQAGEVDEPNCHGSCVKMLQFAAKKDVPQQLDIHGVTIANPPYHSFVIYGDENNPNKSFEMRVSDYKQVGAWYWQTDGMELYEGGRLDNSFFHSNDDVLKLYFSHIRINNTVIWKVENGPVIQFGWTPRNIEDIVVKDTYVIHNRMYWRDTENKYNTCLINSSKHYARDGQAGKEKADPQQWVKNLTIDTLISEGRNLCAMRLFALSSWENISLKNIQIEQWNDLDKSSQYSFLETLSYQAGTEKTSIGNESVQGKGIKIQEYQVGGETISRDAENWEASKLGRLNFNVDHWDSWNAN